MKLDYDLIKEILEEMEEKGDGLPTEDNQIQEKDFEDSDEKKQEYKTLAYHYKRLIVAKLISGKVEIRKSSGIYVVPWAIERANLTLEGHQVLEAMRDIAFWNKTKGNTIDITEEELKQNPALAIKLFMG